MKHHLMKISISFFVGFAAAMTSFDVGAQELKRLVVREVRVKKPPRGPLDLMKDCLNNDWCKTAAQAGAAAMGIDPSYVEYGKTASNWISNPSSEETVIRYENLKGYALCQVDVSTESARPSGGSRAAFFYIDATRDRARVHIWTPQMPPFEGNSFWNGFLTFHYVRQDHVSKLKKCGLRPKQSTEYRCRGTKGNKTAPACGNFSVGAFVE